MEEESCVSSGMERGEVRGPVGSIEECNSGTRSMLVWWKVSGILTGLASRSRFCHTGTLAKCYFSHILTFLSKFSESSDTVCGCLDFFGCILPAGLHDPVPSLRTPSCSVVSLSPPVPHRFSLFRTIPPFTCLFRSHASFCIHCSHHSSLYALCINVCVSHKSPMRSAI